MRFLLPALVTWILFGTPAGAAEVPLSTLLPDIDWAAGDIVRSGNYPAAIAALSADTPSPDSAGRRLALAWALAAAGDTAAALPRFAAATADPALAPIAWGKIGDLLAARAPDSALACFGRALEAAIPTPFRRQIFEKIHAIVDTVPFDSVTIADKPWGKEFLTWQEKEIATPPHPLEIGIDSALAAKNWQSVDSLSRRAYRLLGKGARGAIAARIDSAMPPAKVFSISHRLAIAKAAFETGRYAAASRFLDAVEKRRPTANSSKRELLRLSGEIAYAQRKYDRAIKLLRRYTLTYGNDSKLLLSLGRACIRLDRTTEAARWYDRFTRAFPGHSGVPSVLWLRAWMEQEQGNNAKAMDFLRRIYRFFPRSSRAEDALVRYALFHYRALRYDSAIAAFSLFERKYPLSSRASMAGYWKAKTFYAAGALDSTRVRLAEVASREPYDYYACRARTLAASLGDSLPLLIDTLGDHAGAVRWLDSVAAPGGRTLSTLDSLNLRRGFVLASIGEAEAATMFLSTVDARHHANLPLVFRIGSVYRHTGITAQAAMTGRRFSWRIPSDARASIPLPVLSLMFPSSYAKRISEAARTSDLDPALALGVIRQESVFDARIVSPAGAIGLMQIMPATGKKLAGELKVPFVVDSLYNPDLNIRFGVYYLRQLLDRFDGNEALALAGYNAGPHNAKRWYLRNGIEDIDLFIEDIGYAETRGYVKKVLGNYWFYRALLEAGRRQENK